jgi:DNA primase small subunit
MKKIFREYYNRDFSLSEAFPMIERREFGFLTFDGKTMLRHIGFQTRDNLESFLKKETYSDAFYSCAYYENPEAEMDKKGWLGADLVFDIDADHIPTSCNKIHDEWGCSNCGLTGKGILPERCPICGSQKINANTWPCEVCLESAKLETIKLLDMLIRDFGFSERDVHVFFSGHRGYHIHVENEVVKTLDAVARKEIVDYVSGLGFDVIFHGFNGKNWKMAHALQIPKINDFSWRGRIAKGVYDFISNAKEEDFKSVGLKKNVAETLSRNRDMILKSLEGAGPSGTVKEVDFENWRKIVEFCVKSQSAKIDTVVTTDIHRLIRLADTLHGKTGLKKVEFSMSAIDVFDPFMSAVAFKIGTVSVFVSDAPEFRLGDKTFGPYKNQKAELPTAAAVLLICKGRAEVLE